MRSAILYIYCRLVSFEQHVLGPIYHFFRGVHGDEMETDSSVLLRGSAKSTEGSS